MIYFKSCSRCGGDTYAASDWYGAFVKCLQCGWSLDTDSEADARQTGMSMALRRGRSAADETVRQGPALARSG